MTATPAQGYGEYRHGVGVPAVGAVEPPGGGLEDGLGLGLGEYMGDGLGLGLGEGLGPGEEVGDGLGLGLGEGLGPTPVVT